MTEEEEIVETPEEETIDTDIIVDGESAETVETTPYFFTISERVHPDYKMAHNILGWLHDNMEDLVDDDDKTIFGKVNTGFNENILKTFGKRPVCDVYIQSVEYSGDFDRHIPTKVHSIVLFYMKGANNQTYSKACELHDFIMQEFLTNDSFKEFNNIVRNTIIENSEIRNENIRGGYGVMGVFELTHDLYL